MLAAALALLAVAPTITAQPATVAWGQHVSLAGTASGARVTIEGRQCGVPGAGFRELAEAAVQGGRWHVRLAAATTTVFRAVVADQASAEVTVRARPYVQLRPRGGGRFDVGVNALVPFWGRRVEVQLLQRRTGTWQTIRRVRLTEQAAPGVFVWTGVERPFRLQVPRGARLRAVLPAAAARPCYLAGYSPVVRA